MFPWLPWWNIMLKSFLAFEVLRPQMSSNDFWPTVIQPLQKVAYKKGHCCCNFQIFHTIYSQFGWQFPCLLNPNPLPERTVTAGKNSLDWEFLCGNRQGKSGGGEFLEKNFWKVVQPYAYFTHSSLLQNSCYEDKICNIHYNVFTYISMPLYTFSWKVC